MACIIESTPKKKVANLLLKYKLELNELGILHYSHPRCYYVNPLKIKQYTMESCMGIIVILGTNMEPLQL